MLSAGTPHVAQTLNLGSKRLDAQPGIENATGARPSQIYTFDEFELDTEALQLRRAGVPLKVDALVLRLLECFVRSPGRLFSKDELVTLVWDGRSISENALTVAIARVRKTLSAGPRTRDMVATVYGRGYRFQVPVSVRRSDEQRLVVEHGTAVSEPRCVGREAVLMQLESALAATRTGRGCMIALLGDAGIGKTRVAEVISRSPALAGFASAWGYFRQVDDAPPLWPFAGLLREIFDQVPNAVRSSARFTALLPQLARLLPELTAAASATPDERRSSKYGAFDAVTRSLALAAEAQPLLLVLEDLQHAHEISLELLEYLLTELPRTRVLVLITARQRIAGSLGRVLCHRNCRQLQLTPLDQTQVARYVESVFGAVDETLSSAMFDMSEGNPSLLSELATQLHASSQLDVAALRPHELALPFMKQRMSQLSAATQEVLARAAVLGRNFDLPLLAAACDRSASELMASLDEALAHGAIQRVDDSLTDFSFTHALLHTGLYEAWQPAARRHLHVKLLEALELQRKRSPVPSAALAHHARAAFPEGDLRKTVRYCSDAAESAAHAGDFAAATRDLRQAQRALDLVHDADPSQRLGLMLRQAELARVHATHDFPELVAAWLRLARDQADAAHTARIGVLLDPAPGLPRLPLLGGALSDTLRRLPSDATEARATLLARLASHAPAAYAAATSGEQLERALDLTDRADDLAVRFDELFHYAGPAHELRGRKTLERLQRSCTERDAGPWPALMLDLHRAIVALQAGQWAPLQRALVRCAARCRGVDSVLSWHVERFHALTRIFRGDRADGLELLRALHQRAFSGTELACAYDQSVLLGRGAADPLALAPAACDAPHVWALKLCALAATGALTEAQDALSLVPAARLAQLPCDREFLGTCGALARAALDLQAEPYARAIYELLLPYPTYYAAGLLTRCEGSVSLLLGLLARSFGDTERARQHLEAAMSLSHSAGLTPSAAEARLALNACG